MTIQDIGLFQALAAKMDYLNQRQGVIAQNIANSDTPNYKPKDLTPVDFSSVLNQTRTTNAAKPASSVSMNITNKRHIGLTSGTIDAKTRAQKDTYEVAPSGNAVVIEEQLINSSKNMMDYSLMLNIYQKHIGMIKTALGK